MLRTTPGHLGIINPECICRPNKLQLTFFTRCFAASQQRTYVVPRKLEKEGKRNCSRPETNVGRTLITISGKGESIRDLQEETFDRS